MSNENDTFSRLTFYPPGILLKFHEFTIFSFMIGQIFLVMCDNP